MNSIIQQTKCCYVCHRLDNLHLHHILFGKNRRKCDEDKLTVWLCREHHEGTKGVHGKEGHSLDVELKRIAQETWMEYYSKTKEEFIKRYHKNYV